jgi:hypothetical protein
VSIDKTVRSSDCVEFVAYITNVFESHAIGKRPLLGLDDRELSRLNRADLAAGVLNAAEAIDPDAARRSRNESTFLEILPRKPLEELRGVGREFGGCAAGFAGR